MNTPRYWFVSVVSSVILGAIFCPDIVFPLPRVLGDQPRVVKQTTVYFQPGRFGGWPANHGMWSWGNEIVVGFSVGYYQDRGVGFHAIDHARPERHVLARSLDGGNSWSLEDPERQGVLVGTKGMRHGTLPDDVHEPAPVDCPGGVDFTHPDFAMTVRMADVDGGQSRFYYSLDRAHTWKGPFRLPLCGQTGIAARTDYLVNGPHDCLMFVTASKRNGKEGRPICIRTTDGALSWQFVSAIGPEPTGYAIMPSTVRLSGTDLLTTIRRREQRPQENDAWIDAWLSRDNGQHWRFLNRAAPDLGEGNPPVLVRLRDGRVCLIYGVRKPPYRMEARLSGDGGNSWSKPFVLRSDGASRDLGYPRAIQRPDGKVVAVYYFNDRSHVERTIEATIWDPGS
jgi:BNR repeat-like domain